MGRCVDLDEKVTVQFYDQECEEWTMQTVTIEDVLDSVCDEYTVLSSAQPKSYREGYQAGFKNAQPERIRGKWKLDPISGVKPYGYICNLCGAWQPVERNFCPNCGADMREVDDERPD